MLPKVFHNGFVVGAIGASAVAVWFLVVDLVGGRPFATPALLGSAVFWGVRDPTDVQITYAAVVGYTMLHAVAFFAVGVIAAAFACMVERFPSTLFLIVVFFAVFEFGFYVLVALMAQPLLGALAWWSVALGNLIAAGGMGYYLWQAHPRIRESLALHPLGDIADGE